MGKPLLEVGPDRITIAYEIARPQEQVHEIELARSFFQPLVTFDNASQLGTKQSGQVGIRGAREVPESFAQFPVGGLNGCAGHSIAVVLAEPGPRLFELPFQEINQFPFDDVVVARSDLFHRPDLTAQSACRLGIAEKKSRDGFAHRCDRSAKS